MSFGNNITVYALISANGTDYSDYGSGYCLPASCNTTELIEEAFSTIPIDMDATYSVRTVRFPKKPFPTVSVCVSVALALVLLTPCAIGMLCAPCAGSSRVACALRMLRDLYSATSIRASLTRQGPAQLRSLDGIRVLSTLWIIFFHVLSLILKCKQQFRNEGTLIADTVSWWLQSLLGGYMAVDTFFMMSGLLGFKKLLSVTPRRTVWKLPIARLLRYASMSMLIVIVFSWVVSGFGDGPNWWYVEEQRAYCAAEWWRNLLIFPQIVNCVPWFWYLSNELQLYIVVLVPAALLARWRPRAGFVYAAAWFAASIVITFLMSALRYPNHALDEFVFYRNAFCRLPPYCYGPALVALAAPARQARLRAFFAPRRAAPWVVGAALFAVAAAIIFVHNSATEPTLWGRYAFAAYDALYRPLFSLFAAYVIAAGQVRPGNAVARLLAHPLWTPLARLSFGAYAWHPVIFHARETAMRASPFYSWIESFLRAFGIAFLAYVCSLLSYVLLERPVAALIRRFVAQRSLMTAVAEPERLHGDALLPLVGEPVVTSASSQRAPPE
eukprot:gnl/Chilomastix_cuspidata/3219.p1 GENE.gnl/Chilomastix_cuspidata/3219~~gnl/Chilomastix_cuspidata/3219.p1  ORF type:complete len:632 (-),score=137.51 gnl/Chilomastix_cuspidata/3219:43-1710(-)